MQAAHHLPQFYFYYFLHSYCWMIGVNYHVLLSQKCLKIIGRSKGCHMVRRQPPLNSTHHLYRWCNPYHCYHLVTKRCQFQFSGWRHYFYLRSSFVHLIWVICLLPIIVNSKDSSSSVWYYCVPVDLFLFTALSCCSCSPSLATERSSAAAIFALTLAYSCHRTTHSILFHTPNLLARTISFVLEFASKNWYHSGSHFESFAFNWLYDVILPVFLTNR